MSRVAVRRALVSVKDTSGLGDLARRLDKAGVEIVSSGGTARHLIDEGIAVTEVEHVTGTPEMLGGRVKTLHPAIHGGILADPAVTEHREDLERHGIEPFQLVVVNLYPFEAAVAAGVERVEIIEQIDIGGPALIRAAAKNHAAVGVVVSPDRYEEIAAAVATGGLPAELRLDLAREAFFRTAAYDAAIVTWLERNDTIPGRMAIAIERVHDLRYGENPHQPAGLYASRGENGWWNGARRLQGKDMSFNNYADAEAAWRLVNELPGPGAVVVKHTNPCGVAVAATTAAAFTAAWECDSLAAFGGVVALNRSLGADTAALIADYFVEVVIAPEVESEALDVLVSRRNLRVIEAPVPHDEDLDMRRIEGAFLVQERDTIDGDGTGLPRGWAVASRRQPTAAEVEELRFAWTVAAHTKSNAVIVARDGAAVGVGAGDQSRVGAAERALVKAGPRAQGAVAAGDAFFPFRDAIDLLAGAGITAIVEPGGSMRDDEVIAAADEHGVAMVMTGRRHFLH
jgi:phosphoribosylaminoimidazolecarboxamide formyltransferase/IMP cyclohydrolase